MVEYVASLREGILEAYTGIVTGLKNTEKCMSLFFSLPSSHLTLLSLATLLLPHIPHILELVQKCLADSERTDSVVKLSVGLIGDLADTFPDGQIKQLLLAEWIMNELRARGRYTQDIKRTLRWAREASRFDTCLLSSPDLSCYRWSSGPLHRYSHELRRRARQSCFSFQLSSFSNLDPSPTSHVSHSAYRL